MQITSSHVNINSYQSWGHASGCSCSSCCKNTSAGESTVQTSHDKEEEPSNKLVSELSSSEKQQLTQLQQRDNEVRAHEAAHIASGGSVISGGASFTYQEGPDGKLYAVGGEVPISISSGSTPQENIQIAKQVQSAALAPASPSPQDLKVAASAAMMEARARQELSQMKREEMESEADLQSYQTYQNNKEESNKDLKLDLLA